MKSKVGLVALSVMASLVLFSGNSAEAKTESTDKKKAEPVVVVVKEGDTLSSIAEAHETTYVRLYNANEAIQNPDMIDVGNKIRIPEPDEQLTERTIAAPAVVAPATASSNSGYVPARSAQAAPASYTAASSAGNTYYSGSCTWYAKNRRPDLPNRLGNGGQWAASARAQGRAVGSVPQAGAIAEQPGHVAYVESVNGDGTVNISEMGFYGNPGVNYRTAPASNFTYIY